MTSQTISFSFTDPIARQASREYWLSFGRHLFSPGLLGLVALVAGLFGWSVWRQSHRAWIILFGAAPLLFLLILGGWLLGLWWLPRAAVAKLKHLPHRTVEATFGESVLTVQTATERLEVSWADLREVVLLPSFCVVRLKGGADIPIPRTALDGDLEASLLGLAKDRGAPVSTGLRKP